MYASGVASGGTLYYIILYTKMLFTPQNSATQSVVVTSAGFNKWKKKYKLVNPMKEVEFTENHSRLEKKHNED